MQNNKAFTILELLVVIAIIAIMSIFGYPKVDQWLTDFYTEHGINQGKVDQGGRDYWTDKLAGGMSQAEVENHILWAAANN